jgi:Carboxypeptidase regulatory-like domain
MNTPTRKVSLLFSVLLLMSVTCLGQAGRAEIFGTIQDPTGLPISGAHVEAQSQDTNVRYPVTSDERGEYHLIGLLPGTYSLTVEAKGFSVLHQSGLTLRIGEQTEISLKLQVGQASESVQVDAQAPLLQTASGAVTFSLDQNKIVTLPLDGRNFIPLVALSPGVALPGGGNLLPRINGSRPRTNEYLYDGISIVQPEPGQVVFYPIIDGIEEFKLNINSYSPEYGRSNGGTVMVVGKSGGNQFHGTLFEFIRNEDLNARNLFSPPGPKPEYRRNQYGLTFGGPIVEDKTFFFVDWQGTRLRTAVTRISSVPTDAQRDGIFSSPIKDPATNFQTNFANNTIPQNQFDSTAKQVLAHYPHANLSGTANNYTRTAVEPDNQDQVDGRIDHSFSQRQRVFARYSYFQDNDAPVTPLPDGSGVISSGVTGHAITHGYAIAGDYAWTISPAMLNQARFGYSRRSLDQTGLQNGDITVPGLPPNSFPSVLPTFLVAGIQQIGPSNGANSNFTTSVTEYLDTVTMVRGRHTLKFGVDLRREALDVLNPPNPTGAFTFNTSGTGNSIASLELGQVNAFSIDIQERLLQERAHIAEAFVGDEWRVNNRLSLNFGTRYTLNFPSTEVNNQGAVFNLRTQVLDFPRTGRNLDCCDFGPRAGLAYRIGESMVLRAGYGMMWFEQSGITTPFTFPQFPFVQTVSQQSQDNIHAAFVLSNGPTVQVTAPNPNSGLGQGVFSTDRGTPSGNSQQWNFTVQKTFGSNWNLEVAYLGSKNTHLGIADPNLNQLPDSDLALGSALLKSVPNPYFGIIPASSSIGGPNITAQQLLRPYPKFTKVAYFRNNIANSSYNALAAKLEKRLGRGLTFTAAYTFSKLIDDASSVFSNTIFTGPVLNASVPADANNLRLERSLSNGDIPQVFSAGWTYQIPRVWKISGWQIAGVVRIQSGDMVTVSQATNSNSNLGFGVQRPNLIADPNSPAVRTTARWFNTAAFALAPQFTLGNATRNPVRGPGLQNADLMIGKTFRITERMALEFRAEVFNVSNTPPLNDPSGTTCCSGAFGSITSAGNPRDFEFVGKFHF